MNDDYPKGGKGIGYAVYRLCRWLVAVFYPRMELKGLENLPEGECIVVGNHTQMNGPICAELYFPGKRRIWCAGQMMHLKEVPAYAYQDFWSGKPGAVRWFYKLLSYIIAPLSVCVFNNARTIPVYHDNRLLTTFKQTVSALQEGMRVIIYPECAQPYNQILYQFQDRFIDVAKLYYKRSGKAVSFVPMYIAPSLKTMYLGKPITFQPDQPIEEERARIRDYLMTTITEIAESLPEHVVVPYLNLPKKEYPMSLSREVKTK